MTIKDVLLLDIIGIAMIKMTPEPKLAAIGKKTVLITRRPLIGVPLRQYEMDHTSNAQLAIE